MADDVDDEAILAGVRAAPESAWRELWTAVDELLAQPQWVQWEPPETGPDGVLRVGYPVYSDALDRVWRAVGGVGAVVPYDWMHWDGHLRYRGGEGLDRAPAADAVRMLTAIFRGERFGDGTIDTAMRTGQLPAALARLRRWHDEERRR